MAAAVLQKVSAQPARTMRTPLVNSILSRDFKTLDFLLRYRPDLNRVDEHGMTPVMYAASALDYKVVRRLQEAGADLLARGPGTSTVMSLAADAEPRNAHEARQKDKILNLLQRGKVLGTTLAWEIAISTNLALLGQPAGGLPAGAEALMKAAREGKRRRVRALLHAGVDPNARDSYGLTAAHQAAGAGYKTILKELAAHGADFSLADKFGNDVAVHAISGGSERLGRWVSRQEVDGGQPVSPAISAITEMHSPQQNPTIGSTMDPEAPPAPTAVAARASPETPAAASPPAASAIPEISASPVAPAKPETSASPAKQQGRGPKHPLPTYHRRVAELRAAQPGRYVDKPDQCGDKPCLACTCCIEGGQLDWQHADGSKTTWQEYAKWLGQRDKLVFLFDQPIASAPDPDAQESLCAALDGALALDMTSVAADYEEIMQHIQAARPNEPDAGGAWTESLERLSAFARNCRPLAGADQFADEFAGEPTGVIGSSLDPAFSI